VNTSDLAALAIERGLRGRVLANEPLSRHTSFRIGGPADFLVAARAEKELCAWVAFARELGMPSLVMGGGTNLLVADEGVRGLVIENRSSDITIDVPSRTVNAQAGVSLSRLAHETASGGSAGLEWAVGIPGTVGGALVSNAGAFDGTIADVARSVRVLDGQGQIRNLPAEGLGFGYRASRFRDGPSRGEVILSAQFELAPESMKVLLRRIDRYRASRRASQPTQPSAGSVFKNPPAMSAGRLIEEAGLKSRRIGDAQVSPKHANYIVNLGRARAQDVLELIDLIKHEVYKRFQVELELEIELVGQWHKA
jgi:UDP-N-acetylmuramate dehydrogenase